MQMTSHSFILYVAEMMKVYGKFSLFSGTRPDKSKCEVVLYSCTERGENRTVWNQ